MDARRAFAATRWSLIARATGVEEGSRAALEELAAGYWYPLYAFARRRGASPEDAEDLVQSFFARLLEKAWLEQADRDRGRFRTFLLAAFRHHTSHVAERAAARKRGGDRAWLSLDGAESRYEAEASTALAPEALYERRYALALIDRAWARLAERTRARGPDSAERFDVLRPYLEEDDTPVYRVTATRLGLSETAVKVAVHRMRGHFRDALRAEVADTLDDPASVDDEIRRLMEAVASST